MKQLTTLTGDCRTILPTLESQSVQCVVTSPPYWGLRDYGHKKQIGQEKTPQAYVRTMRKVFAEIWRVLRDDGTVWLNLGDSYAGNSSGQFRPGAGRADGKVDDRNQRNRNGNVCPPTCKPKDLIGIPWLVAFALRKDGWYLRSDIIWAKPNCMPESVTDRPTRSHEYIFLLTKSEKYFYDYEAIKEPCAMEYTGRAATFDRTGNAVADHIIPNQSAAQHRSRPKADKQRGHSRRHDGFNDRWDHMEKEERCSGTRNKRDVWTVAPANFNGAHFATFPPELIKPCILAGTKPGDMVLDPFFGSGCTGMVALELGRRCTGIELNPEYIPIIEQRTDITPGLCLL